MAIAYQSNLDYDLSNDFPTLKCFVSDSSFIPESAIPLYNYFLMELNTHLLTEVKSGVFGADMKISLINDGPVTIIIDSKKKE